MREREKPKQIPPKNLLRIFKEDPQRLLPIEIKKKVKEDPQRPAAAPPKP